MRGLGAFARVVTALALLATGALLAVACLAAHLLSLF